MDRRLYIFSLLLIMIAAAACRARSRDLGVDEQHFTGEYGSADKNVSISDKDGNSGWSQWSDWSLCSRTCDGGISRQLRSCSNPDGCRGEPVRYKICNMQPCHSGTNLSQLLEQEDSWRAQQCSAYDDTPYGGLLYSWRPHKDEHELCALTCRGTIKHQMPRDEVKSGEDFEDGDSNVIAVLASRVLDGTRCRYGSLDMCIDGRCQRVGCDLRVGSTLRVDECGVCGGDGTTCSKPRYKWMISAGTPCSVSCGGGYRTTKWRCFDKLTGEGVSETLCDLNKKPGDAVIICNDHACPFSWFVSMWGSCTAKCGGGIRERRVICARAQNDTENVFTPGSEDLPCTEPAPPAISPCNTHRCPEWIIKPWSGCSVSCGSGVQVREVVCLSDGLVGQCDPMNKPEVQRSCSTGIPCPGNQEEDDVADMIPGVVYHTQPLIQEYPPPQAKAERLTGEPEMPSEATFIKEQEWSSCSVSCGIGFRKREVHCKIFLEFSRTIATLPDSKCAGTKPDEDTERCDAGPCPMAFSAGNMDGVNEPIDRSLTYGSMSNIRVAPGSPGKSYSWKEKGYTSCSASCLSGVQELIIQCVRDEDGKNASPYMCDPHTKPENRVRTCNDHPCPPRWNYTDFSACTKSCGIGIQTREVSCIHEVTRGGGNTVVVPNSMCPQPPPPDRQYCNVLDCPVKWHSGDWSKCSRTCGGGIKERKVECKQIMAQSHIVERPPNECGLDKPPSTRACNTRPCEPGIVPHITHDNSSYIQHDPRKTMVTVKVGGSATLFSGTQVKIKCPVKGYNKTKVSWTKDGRRLEKSKKFKISRKGALRITQLTSREAGLYVCTAAGSRAELQLIVKQRPGELTDEIDRRAAPRTMQDPLDEGRYKNIGYDAKAKFKVKDGTFSATTIRYNPVPSVSREQRTIEFDSSHFIVNNNNGNIHDEAERNIIYDDGDPIVRALSSKENAKVNKDGNSKNSIDETSNEPYFNNVKDDFRTNYDRSETRSNDDSDINNVDLFPINGLHATFIGGLEDRHMIIPRDDGDDVIIVNDDTEVTVEELRNKNDSYWFIGEWGNCCPVGLSKCPQQHCLPKGKGVQTRQVRCTSAGNCFEPKPVTRRTCYTKVCRVYWKPGIWSQCTCEGRQHRTLQCVGQHKRAVLNGTVCKNRRPRVSRACVPEVSCYIKCENSSRFCDNVRAMNLCFVKKYKKKCCKACLDSI